MPKPTFYNLPEEKKQTLTDALLQEFSRAPLFDASIANIVKTAGIPRGSFYQYFEDKDDAFFYALKVIAERKQVNLIFLLRRHDGDIFDAMAGFHRQMLREDEHLAFFRNAFLNMTQKIEQAFFKYLREDLDCGPERAELFACIDAKKLSAQCENEMIRLLQIITATSFRNLAAAFAQNLSPEEAEAYFQMDMMLLKKGLETLDIQR